MDDVVRMKRVHRVEQLLYESWQLPSVQCILLQQPLEGAAFNIVFNDDCAAIVQDVVLYGDMGALDAINGFKELPLIPEIFFTDVKSVIQ